MLKVAYRGKKQRIKKRIAVLEGTFTPEVKTQENHKAKLESMLKKSNDKVKPK